MSTATVNHDDELLKNGNTSPADLAENTNEADYVWCRESKRPLRAPWCVDFVHNNVRSRPMLATTFAAVTAATTIFVVLLLVTLQEENVQIKLWTQPQQKLKFGVPAEPFLVQVKNDDGGLSGVDVDIYLYPKNVFDLSMSFNQQLIKTRSINCAVFLTFPTDVAYGVETEHFCDPTRIGKEDAGIPAVYHTTATTDDQGMAMIANLTLTYGYPGEYHLVAQHNLKLTSSNVDSNFVSTPVTFELQVVNVDEDGTVVKDSNEDAHQYIDVATHTPMKPFSVNVSWIGDWNEFCAPRQPARRSDGKGSGGPLVAPLTPMGSIISLNVQSYMNRYSGMQIVNDTVYRSATWKNNYVAAKCISYDAARGVIHGRLDFDKVTLTSAQSNKVYPAVFFFGTVIPLRSYFYSKLMTPDTLLVPHFVSSSVESVELSANGVEAKGISEQALFTIDVTLSAHDSDTLDDRGVYVFAIPQVFQHIASKTALTPASDPKTLLFAPLKMTNAKGVASFSDVRFTSKGSPGMYKIYAVVDGVYSKPFTVQVNSVVDPSRCTWYNLNEAAQVSVTEPWNVKPIVRVVNDDGQPIPGKRGDVGIIAGPTSTTDMSRSFVKAVSLSSDSDGYLVFASIEITSVPVEGSYTFAISVDNKRITTFTKVVKWQRDIKNDIVGENECRYLDVLSIDPIVSVSGLPTALKIRALDSTGATVAANATFTITGDTTALMSAIGDSTSPANSKASTVDIPALTTGYFDMKFTTRITQDEAVTVRATCGGGTFDTEFQFFARPRVKSFFVYRNYSSPTPYETCLSVTTQDTSDASDQYPLTANFFTIARPLYIQTYYTVHGHDMHNFAPQTVTSVSTSSHTATTCFAPTVVDPMPGVFIIGANMDGTVASSVILLSHDTPSNHPVLTVRDSWVRGAPTTGVDASLPQFREVLTHQPVVNVRSPGGAAITGVRVYAEVAYVDPDNKNTLVPVDFGLNTSSIEFGAVGTLLGGTRIMPAISGKTDQNGDAYFSNLLVVGLKPGLRYTVRYILYPDEILNPILPSGAKLMPNYKPAVIADTISALVPSRTSVEFLLKTEPPPQVAPGLPLSMTVTAVPTATSTFTGGNAIRFIMGRPVTDSLTSRIHLPPTQYAFYMNVGNTVEMDNFYFSPTSKLGAKNLYILAPGVRQKIADITLASAAAGITVVKEPPLFVRVGEVFTASVRVVLRSGVGVPNVPVVATLKTHQKGCIQPEKCGTLSKLTRPSISGANGLASFAFVITESANVTGKEFTNSFFQIIYTVDLSADTSQLNGLFYVSTLLGYSPRISSPVFEQTPGTILKQLTAPINVPTESSALDKLKESSPIISHSYWFHVANDVGSVEIIRQPEFEMSATSSVVPLPKGFSVQPKIRILDVYGKPLANLTATLRVIHSNSKSEDTHDPQYTDVVEISYNTAARSDVNGIYTFQDLTVQRGPPGSYRLMFFVKGITSREGPSDTFTIPSALAFSNDTLMKLFAFGMVIVFFPLFFANIPRSSKLWMIPGMMAAGSVGAVGIALVMEGTFDRAAGNNYLRAHVFFGSALCLLLVVMCIVLMVLLLLRKKLTDVAFIRSLSINDGDRAERAFLHTQWLLHARRERQTSKQILQQMNTDLHETRSYKILKWIDDKTAHKFLHVHDHHWLAFDERFNPPELDCPEEAQFNFVPTRLYVTVGVSIVIWFVLLLCSLYAFEVVDDIVDRAVAVLGVYARPIELLSENDNVPTGVIKSAITTAFTFIGNQGDGQYRVLLNLVPIIQDVDVDEVLKRVGEFAASLQDHLLTAQILATICGTLVMIVTWLSLWRAVPKYIIAMRRGAFKEERDHARHLDADRYVGLHTMHLLLLCILVFGGTLIGYICTAVPMIRELFADLLLSLITYSLISIVVFFIVSNFIVDPFIVHGKEMYHNGPYLAWSVLAMLWFVFNAIFHTIFRFIVGIVTLCLVFGRVDIGVVPAAFLMLDMGHHGFWAMMAIYAEYNNPTAWCFASILLHRQQLRHIAATSVVDLNNKEKKDPTANKGDSTAKKSPADGVENTGRKSRSGVKYLVDDVGSDVKLPHMRNLVQLHARHGTDNHLDLDDFRLDHDEGVLPRCFDNLVEHTVTVVEESNAEDSNGDVEAKLLQGNEPQPSSTTTTTTATTSMDFSPVVRRERVIQRFWLWMILHNNPSLRQFRKHQLKAREEMYFGTKNPSAQHGAHDEVLSAEVELKPV